RRGVPDEPLQELPDTEQVVAELGEQEGADQQTRDDPRNLLRGRCRGVERSLLGQAPVGDQPRDDPSQNTPVLRRLDGRGSVIGDASRLRAHGQSLDQNRDLISARTSYCYAAASTTIAGVSAQSSCQISCERGRTVDSGSTPAFRCT